MTLGCADIGISQCDFTASYEGGRSALEQMVEHLHKKHGFHVTAEQVAGGKVDHLEDPERMIAARLHRRMIEPSTA
jgi:predicted small metal-binding protein